MYNTLSPQQKDLYADKHIGQESDPDKTLFTTLKAEKAGLGTSAAQALFLFCKSWVELGTYFDDLQVLGNAMLDQVRLFEAYTSIFIVFYDQK